MASEPTFVLGVDLDGVVGDYETAMRHAVADQLGLDPQTIPPATDWVFSRVEGWPIRDSAHFLELHNRAVTEQRMLRDMPLVPGASEGLWELSDAGVWIRIVTHRLLGNSVHARTVADTVEFLDRDITAADGSLRKAIPYRDLCFVADKPSVGCDIYVDDAPHNITALRASGAEAICFAQPYNTMVPGPRAADWPELVAMVLDARDRTLASAAR